MSHHQSFEASPKPFTTGVSLAEDFAFNHRELSQEHIGVEDIQSLSQGLIELINVIRKNHINVVFMIDTGARPLASLLKKIWNKIFPLDQLPDIKFINISSRRHIQINEPLYKEVQQLYGPIIGKNILIVDDFAPTGKTLAIAKNVIQSTYPDNNMHCLSLFQGPPFWWYIKNWQSVMSDVDKNSILSTISIHADPKKKWFRDYLEKFAKAVAENCTHTSL